MRDYVTAPTEAVRLARLEIACYRDNDCRSTAEFTVKRLEELLYHRGVNEAMAVLSPNEASPSIVPELRERHRRSLKENRQPVRADGSPEGAAKQTPVRAQSASARCSASCSSMARSSSS